MSEYAIAIVGVDKKFKRFRHPGWRALDALGVHVPRTTFDEFTALSGIDLNIKKGEKVALIGRNGAGKSTLLRVISGQMQADCGRLRVNGKVQALMELGTGFHPDFTGIDNIRSALAYQGAPASSVAQWIGEIVEFTELDEFISRPVREYSAGMYARLAFAVATTITPEILIIDEVLGAGDAYFMGKCIQRMKDLTNQGATILFVSHDMSAVQLLCDRGVWIEKGMVKADGDILNVSKAYQASVRADEEIRIRARSMAMTRTHIAAQVGRTAIALYRLIGSDGQAPAEPAAVSAIRYGSGADTVATVSSGDEEQLSRMIVERGITNWSHAMQIDRRMCRQFGRFDGKFVHAPWQIDWSGRNNNQRWIEIDYRPSVSTSLALEAYDKSQNAYVRLAEIGAGDAACGWQTMRIDIDGSDACGDQQVTPQAALDLEILCAQDRYGEGPIRIMAFGFIDRHGTRRHTLITGEDTQAVMTYDASEQVHDPVAVLAIYRPDGSCALQVTSNRDDRNLGVLSGQGSIVASFAPFLLGPGDYNVSVALFKELNLALQHEPAAYDLHDRCYVLKVLPPPGIGINIGTVNQPASWSTTL